jgi:hypothetical protein
VIRISAALHNDLDQFERLANALLEVLTEQPAAATA